MNLNKYLNMEEIEKLTDIQSNREGYFFGTIKSSGHYLKIVEASTIIFCTLNNKYTYNNSIYRSFGDINSEISMDLEKEDITNKIKELIEIANIVFKHVPEKYWKNYLSIKY